MPLKARSIKPDELSKAEGHADKVYARLLSFLDLSQGFSLGLAVCRIPGLRKILLSRLSADTAKLGLDLRVADISKSYCGDFALAVRENMGPPTARGRPAVMVTGIDPLVYSTDDLLRGKGTRPTFVTRLNFDRERISAELPFPIVLWLEPEALRLLLREAPDLAQWVSARFDFGDISEYTSYLADWLVPRENAVPQSFAERASRLPPRSIAGTKQGARARRAILLIGQAWEHLSQSKIPEAQKKVREATRLAIAMGDRGTEAAGRDWQGLMYLQQGKVVLAIREWRKALRLFRQLKDHASANRVAVDLASAYLADSDFAAASRLFQSVIESNSAERATMVDAVIGLGLVHASAGRKEEAANAFEKALQLVGAGDSPQKVTKWLMSMGVSVRKLNPSRAIDLLERCLQIARRTGNRWLQATCLANIGFAYQQMAEHRRAISYMEEALRIYEEIDDVSDHMGTGRYLAYILANLGDFDLAQSVVQKSLELARSVRDRRNEASALVSASMVSGMQGDMSAASQYARSAAKLYEQLGDPHLKDARELLSMLQSGKLKPVPAARGDLRDVQP